ncbi:MAG: citrate lyase subunit beta / citryl-CoA lyase [Pseudonocardiales bacterium]|nr:citrate lyase subunit beta / citryl-CoA lyase [Pseudonocardiales bacterium]
MQPPSSPLSAARSWLFVPGNRPERFDKAAGSDADLVIIDLEDAVPAAQRQAARQSARDWLGAGGRAVVRTNAGDDEFSRDLQAIAGATGLLGAVLAKASDAAEVGRRASALGVPVIPLIESAAGLAAAEPIAAVAGVARLALGTIDLALDLGCRDEWAAMLRARCRRVLASRLAGLPGPIDGVCVSIEDQQQVASATRRASAVGFTAKLCIHPAQVAAVHKALRPDEAEIERARAIVASCEAGQDVGRVNGEMIDAPVIAAARALLARV